MKEIHSIKDLYGILNPYINKPLTQDDIDDCLAEVAYLQDLKTKSEHQYIDWDKYGIFDERIYFDETLQKFIIKDE